jgi:AcrR family transcriptional regulator
LSSRIHSVEHPPGELELDEERCDEPESHHRAPHGFLRVNELREQPFSECIVSSVPGSETKTRRRPGRPRRPTTGDAITRAALDLLAERGFQAATIEAIALRAGVGRNTIYRRWSSKEELIADALRELTTDFDAWGAEDLYSLLLNWLRDFARTFSDPLHGRLLAGVLGELHQNPVFADVYADRVVRPRREALLARLTEARGRGELRPDADVELVADLLGGALLLRLLPLGLPAAGETYAEELLETIWRGIAPQPASS